MHYSTHRTLTRLELGQVVFQRVLYLAYTALCRLLVRAWRQKENHKPLPHYVMQDGIQTTRSMQGMFGASVSESSLLIRSLVNIERTVDLHASNNKALPIDERLQNGHKLLN